MSDNKPNPLQKYYRQPKIYISLPSGGKYWKEGSIELPESGEIPVFAMTAKDELMMKTPDALLNGQATVELIQSCIPAIKDAWYTPATDFDAILIAIRIATYGEKMDVSSFTPVISEEKTFSLNLITLMDSIQGQQFSETVHNNDLSFKIRPLTYREMTDTTNETFEEQRIFTAVNNNDMPEAEKIELFRNSFKKLTELTVKTLERSIVSIEVGDDVVTNQNLIAEFIANSDKTIFETLSNHIEGEKDKFKVKPMVVDATPEEIERGVPATYEIPIIFDPSNFFVQGS
jgi:hypothetical protein